MAQADAPPLYWSGDLADADWAGAVADPAVVDDAWQAWRDEVAFAEKYVADAPDLGIRGTMRDGDTIALREVLVHMIEEYARHCGHADLLRERTRRPVTVGSRRDCCCQTAVAGDSGWSRCWDGGGWGRRPGYADWELSGQAG
jgi:hypothetical protein